jgi:hypothetical protein
MTSHLPPEQLLHHLDGELSRSAERVATEHLRACWSCQVEFDRLKQDIAIIFDAQAELFGPSLPSPPKPWPRIEPRLEAASARSLPLWHKLDLFARWRARIPLVYAGAAFALLFIGFLIWAPLASVSAQEVLKRAISADSRRQSITPQQVFRQRVRVKKTVRGAAGAHTTGLVSWKSLRSAYWDYQGDSTSAELFDRYKSIGIQSALPLSPPAVEAWMKLAGSEPSASADGKTISLHAASTGDGRESGLERVGFHVQPRDWHLDQMTLSFTDATFEISEEESSILDRNEVPADVLAVLDPAASQPATSMTTGTPAKASSVNLDDLEMAVRFDLHRIGADLGEGIEIKAHPPGQLVVNAADASSRTKEQLVALFGSEPAIRLEFQAPANDGRTVAVATVKSHTNPPLEAPDERLAQYFGGVAVEENYARPVLQSSTDVLAHWYALRELAVRWPPEKDAQLSKDAKAKLAVMLRDHANQIQMVASPLKKDLDVLLKDQGQPLSDQTALGGGIKWQDASASGLEAALQVDRILRSLLTTSDAPMPVDEALPKLRQGMIDLQLAIAELKASLQ